MGDGEKAPLRVQFNPKVCLEFHGATITSDAGLLPIRELDEALGLTDTADGYLQESRTGRNIRHHLIPLIRQSIYSRLAGYDDTNDAQRLAQDPAMRVIVGWQGSDRNAASTSEMGRFETETLTQEDNLKGLARMNFQWVAGAMAHTPHRRVILDMDSSESPVHGQQEGAAYNGHFECVCYHPLFLFNQFGDCEGATLRSGNVSSADGWQELLEPVVKGYQKKGLRLLFRGDAAFAKPELYEYLEEEKTGYAIRLPANQVVQEQIQPLLEPPTEWPSREPMVSYHDFAYQAQSWRLPRRVVAKVEWHRGELFPRVGFIVTNLSYPPKGIVRFYNGRGTAEQWIKEGKYALNWTRLSCHKFVANQVRLALFVLAYNLGNFLRRLALPESMKHWSLTSLQTRLIKTGGRLVRHARRLVFQLAEVLVTREMLTGMIKRGELTTETEQHGRRHTVWVLMDDLSENSSGVTSEDSGKHIGGDTGAENLALQAEVSGLRELVELYRERLTEADWRHQELLGQLKTLTAALPAGEPTDPKAKRWWWPFR